MSETCRVEIVTEDEASAASMVPPVFLATLFKVPNGQVSSWATRRRSSGFPEPIAFMRHGDSLTPVYDLAVSVEWYSHRPARIERTTVAHRQALHSAA